MIDIREICEHFRAQEACDGVRFFHSDRTETQIQFAQTIPSELLPRWARGETEYNGVLREEALTFLIQHFSQTQPELSDALSLSLNRRMRIRMVNQYRGLLGENSASVFADEVCSDFWAEAFDPTKLRGLWAQLCFWPTILYLAKHRLKKHWYTIQHLTSLDSDRSAIKFVMQLPSSEIPLDDQIYLKEFLDRLDPMQRTAFVLRYSCDSSIKEIGISMQRSATKVKTVLKTTRQLRDAA